MKKHLATFGFLLSCLSIFSQENLRLQDKFNLSIDSLTDWNYDIVPKQMIDTNLIARIVFFRNKEIPDKQSQEVYGNGKRPLMILNIYPISLIDSIKEMSLDCKLFSSCVPPNKGGDYYILQDYILLNYSSCVPCASSDYKTDLCRGNINKIISGIKNKHFSSLEELLDNLPITRKVFR